MFSALFSLLNEGFSGVEYFATGPAESMDFPMDTAGDKEMDDDMEDDWDFD